MGAELFHADRQTDGQIEMTKPIDAFQRFPACLKNASSFASSLSDTSILATCKIFSSYFPFYSLQELVENIKKILSRQFVYF